MTTLRVKTVSGKAAILEAHAQISSTRGRTDAVLSDDGRWVAGISGPSVDMWNAATGARVAQLPHQGYVQDRVQPGRITAETAMLKRVVAQLAGLRPAGPVTT